jgi:lipoprotein NlpD
MKGFEMPGSFSHVTSQVNNRIHCLVQGRLHQALLLALALVLSACGSTRLNRAPVEERGTFPSVNAPVATEVKPDASTDPKGDPGVVAAPAVRQHPGAENAGKPGYYTVKPGDTLIRIGLDNGQNWRDIVRWNALENPNQIEVGQVLRVTAPVAGTAPPVAAGVVTKPVMPPTSTAATLPPAQPPGTASSAPAAPPAAASAPATASGAGGDEDIAWIWPAAGAVLTGFDEIKNKGLDIGGTIGTAVFAAADGRVVYVGAGLRGYGNLIILKHNNTYLTAYAHNQALLVKEDQTVRKGQKIAEMGSSDADRVKLHFEVRRQGKPVDPAKYLPVR